jgi:hypothetical protein
VRGKVLAGKLQRLVNYDVRVEKYFANTSWNLANWQSTPEVTAKE